MFELNFAVRFRYFTLLSIDNLLQSFNQMSQKFRITENLSESLQRDSEQENLEGFLMSNQQLTQKSQERFLINHQITFPFQDSQRRNSLQHEMNTNSRQIAKQTDTKQAQQHTSSTQNLYNILKNEPMTTSENDVLNIQQFLQPYQPTQAEVRIPSKRLTHQSPPEANAPQIVSLSSRSIPKGKNRNLLKYVIKFFSKHPQIVRSVFGEQYSAEFSQLYHYLNNLFKWHRQSPSHNNINLGHLKWILVERDDNRASRVRSLCARMALSRILKQNMRQIVSQKNKIKGKLLYLNCLKVYQLRCRNWVTSIRLQN